MNDNVLRSVHPPQLLSGLPRGAIGGFAASVVGSPAARGSEQKQSAATAPSICVFDVNETLLDIEYLAPIFQRVFDDKKVVREWFNQLILYSNAITLSGPYTTF